MFASCRNKNLTFTPVPLLSRPVITGRRREIVRYCRLTACSFPRERHFSSEILTAAPATSSLLRNKAPRNNGTYSRTAHRSPAANELMIYGKLKRKNPPIKYLFSSVAAIANGKYIKRTQKITPIMNMSGSKPALEVIAAAFGGGPPAPITKLNTAYVTTQHRHHPHNTPNHPSRRPKPCQQ